MARCHSHDEWIRGAQGIVRTKKSGDLYGGDLSESAELLKSRVEMAGKYTSSDSAQGATFGQDAADKVREAKDATFDAARAATKKADEARRQSPDDSETAASMIEERRTP
jgi:hypothetical protein